MKRTVLNLIATEFASGEERGFRRLQDSPLPSECQPSQIIRPYLLLQCEQN